MKKLFTLLTLLVAIVTGAQADDPVTIGITNTTTTTSQEATTETLTGSGTDITVAKLDLSSTTQALSVYTKGDKAMNNGSSTNVYSTHAYKWNKNTGSKTATNITNWPEEYVGFSFTVAEGKTFSVSGLSAKLASSADHVFQVRIEKTDGTVLYTSGDKVISRSSDNELNKTITETTVQDLEAGTYNVKAYLSFNSTSKYLVFTKLQLTGTVGTAGAITPTITTETATVEEGKTVSALDFITAKNGSSTLTDVTYSNFAVSAGSEYVSVAADGTITGLTDGAGHTATITFDSDAVTDKYEKTEGNELTVNVVAAKQELTLAYSGDVELTAGQTFTPATLTATAGGNTVDVATLGLTYESSNTDLATVNATTGEVTLVAKATGTATIKAKLQDNATYSDTEASYTITVNKIPVPKFYIDGVEIANGATVADFTTGQTIVIEAPGYYIYSNWSSSDSKSKSDYYKDGGVKGQDSYKASTLTTGTRVLYAVAGDDEHAQGNSSDLAKVIFSNVTAGSIEVSISAAGYATLYYSSLPLAVPANVTAKTYKVDNGNIVVSKTYAAESVIPQGEPVVLEGAAGDYTFTVKKDENATKDANSMLKGLDAAGQTTGEGLFYKLAQKDGKVGFYWGAAEGAAFALQGDHHAYLVVPASTGAREFYAFSEEVSTGINSANVQTVNDNAPIYNLAGQKVSKGYKGIVIVNGRKMLNK